MRVSAATLVMLGLLSAASPIRADQQPHWLFAVDLSLMAEHRHAATRFVNAVIEQDSRGAAVGLTLFDDTVRGFVSAGSLQDAAQRDRLQSVLQAVPASIRSTSNPAVGIERALDEPVPPGGAELFVFTRGVIDTQTDDPRARFAEWLNTILLPQARRRGIRITLVRPVPTESSVPMLTQAALAGYHRTVDWRSDGALPPALRNRLVGDGLERSVTDPDWTGTRWIDQPLASMASSPVVTTDPRVPVKDVSSGSAMPGKTGGDEESFWPASTRWRVVLLLLAISTLVLLCVWRRRRCSPRDDTPATSTHSAGYLPLSTRPEVSMSHWAARSETSAGAQARAETGSKKHPMQEDR